MPVATCECGKSIHWRNTRGSKLASLRCECGGRLQMPSSPSKNKGKKFQTCGVCRNRSMFVSEAKVPFRLKYDPRKNVFDAGTLVCRLHYDQTLAASHEWFALIEAPITRERLTGWIVEVEAWIARGKPESESESWWAWQCEAPAWLRKQLEESPDSQLISVRNTLMDHIIRARNISTDKQHYPVFGYV